MTTPNMGLTQPGVLTTAGPTYATQQNTDLTLLDAHDHSSGKGVPISQTGLLFTGDVSYQNGTSYYGPTNIAYAQFKQQTLQGAGTKPAAVMVDGSGNLYYQNGSGTNIQLTSGSNIIQTGTGAFNGFYGDYAAAGPSHGATASFTAASATYGFYTDSGSTTLANILGLGYISKGQAANTTGYINLLGNGTQGWQLWNKYYADATGTAFAVTFDPTGSPNAAFALEQTTNLTSNHQYGIMLNTPVSPGLYPLQMNFAVSGSETAAYTFGKFQIGANGNGAPGDNFGQSWIWEASTTQGLLQTPSTMILQSFTWKTIASKIGRWRIYGYSGGVSDATPGIELIGGGPAVGIGVAASVTYPLSVGATANQSATMAGSLTVATAGAAGSVGLTITTGALAVNSGNIVMSSGNLSVLSGTLSVSGTSTLAAIVATTGSFSSTLAAASTTITGTLTNSGQCSFATGGLASTFGGSVSASSFAATGSLGGGAAGSGISAAGTAAGPAWYIGPAINTGIYQPGTHQLGFSTNGTLALTLDASQNATVVGAVTAGGAVTATEIVPTSGPGSGLKYHLNQSNIVYAWATGSAAGGGVRQYNVAYSSHASTGVYKYVLNETISTGAVVIAGCIDSQLRTVVGQVTDAGSTVTITVVTSSTGAAIDAAHAFVVLGA